MHRRQTSRRLRWRALLAQQIADRGSSEKFFDMLLENDVTICQKEHLRSQHWKFATQVVKMTNNTAQKFDATFVVKTPAKVVATFIPPSANPKFDKDIEIESLVAENKREKSEWVSEKEKMIATIKKMESKLSSLNDQIDKMEDNHNLEMHRMSNKLHKEFCN